MSSPSNITLPPAWLEALLQNSDEEISSDDLALVLDQSSRLLKLKSIASLPVTVPSVADTVKFLRSTVNFNTANIANGVIVGQIPAGAQIMRAIVRVITSFNAGTTNVLTVGSNASAYDNIFNAAGISEGAAGNNDAAVANLLYFAAATDIFAKYTQTGTAATQGQAIVNIMYIA